MDEEIQEFFYYIRDRRSNKPVITVCVIKNITTCEWARGVAICSKLEQPIKTKGRHIARGRALRALKHKLDNDLVSRSEAWTIQTNCIPWNEPSSYYMYKSYYNPELNHFEHRIATAEQAEAA